MAFEPEPPPSDPIRPLRPPRPRGGIITVAVLLAVGIAWVTALGRRDRARVTRDVYSARQAFADRLTASPEFRTWALSHPDIKRDGTLAIQRGLHRLDDATLKRRLELTSKVLAAADVRRCAALERGKISEDDMFAMFDKLAPAERDEFNDIMFRAAEADIKGTPPSRWISLGGRRSFYLELRAALAKRPNGDKLLGALDNLSAATDADTCALVRATHDAVKVMPAPLQTTASLLMIGGGGGHALFDDPRWLSLSNGALIQRAEILEELLAQADEKGCAALARHAVPGDQVDAQIQRLPASLRETWSDLSDQLAAGYAPGGPLGDVTDAEMRRYSIAVRRQMGRDRFDQRAFDNPDDVPPAAACHAHRVLVSALLRLQQPLRGIGARVLAGGAP